jgi:transposase
MMWFTLTSRHRVKLQDLMDRTPWATCRCRAQALLWLADRKPVEEVAELLHVTRQTVYNWIDRFQDGLGDVETRLADAPRSGRPRTGEGQLDVRIATVLDQDPHQLGYNSTGWTAPLMVHYLQDYHQIEVSRKTVSRAIERLGLRWKRPRHELALRPDTWRQAKGGSNPG